MLATLSADFDDDAWKDFLTDDMDLHEDFIDRFKKDGIKKPTDLRTKMDSNWDAIYLRTVKDSSFQQHFGDHSLQRLKVASAAVRYLIAVGRTIEPDHLEWDPVLENFQLGMDIIEELKAAPPPTIPKLSKNFGPIKWSPVMRSTLSSCYSVNKSPRVTLDYVIRPTVTPEDPPPDLETEELFAKGGSYAEELAKRFLHKGVVYNADNKLVWEALEKATRGTAYASTVDAYPNNGRKVFFALESQHLGDGKWTAEIEKHDNILHTLVWKGTGNQTLEKFLNIHRTSYNALVTASSHVTYQVPSEHTRVGFLLKNIQTNDPLLTAALSAVTMDKTQDGKRENFEKAAICLQEFCPVANKLNSSKRNIGNISGVEAGATIRFEEPRQGIISSAHMRSGIGQTGVHFRFYEKSDYNQLNHEQKKELAYWRKTPEGIAATEAGKAARAAKKKDNQQKQAAKKQKKFKEAVAAEVAAVFKQAPPAPPVFQLPPAPAPAPPTGGPPGQTAPTDAQVRAAYAIIQQRLHVSSAEAQPPAEGEAAGTPTKPTGVNPWPLLPGILKKTIP